MKETNPSIYLNCISKGSKVEMVLRHGLSLSPAFISHLKYVPNGILLNGHPAKTTDITFPGDMISVRIDDAEGGNPIMPQDCGVQIIFEDDYLAVLSKPSGISTHGKGRSVAANAAYLWGSETTFHPVNRLDTGTSGLMVTAKCRLVHGLLQKQLHTDNFIRRYIAIVEGQLSGEGIITLPVNGKSAETSYKSAILSSNLSYVELQLTTGRMHQIREHMAAIGHPLAGDIAYGGSAELISRPALHSCRVKFQHPITADFFEFSELLPPDMQLLANI